MDDFALRLDERFAAGWFYLTCDGATTDDIVDEHVGLPPVVATTGGLECFCEPGTELRFTDSPQAAISGGLIEAGIFELSCESAVIASASELPIFRLSLERSCQARVYTNQVAKEDRPSKVILAIPELVEVRELMKRPWYRRVFG